MAVFLVAASLLHSSSSHCDVIHLSLSTSSEKVIHIQATYFHYHLFLGQSG